MLIKELRRITRPNNEDYRINHYNYYDHLASVHLGFFNNHLVVAGLTDNSINTIISEGKNNIANTSHAAEKCNPLLFFEIRDGSFIDI